MLILMLAGSLRAAYRDRDIPAVVEDVENWIERSSAGHADSPAYDHTATVNDYYDLCNRFMLFGWSESLQFAPLDLDETLAQAITRHQRLMIAKLGLREGMRVVDVGCGFGVLMRRLAAEAGVSVIGINNNEQQLEQVRVRNREAGLDGRVDCLKCNIMDMSSIEAASFDRGYAIEST
ncbi:MAG: methyltransferase domain-containing protein, partial [Acidimicrobiia bacterium]|nr:methyltransferase domain-containing protein [Acidimicrobiia bacterium]